MSLHFLIDGYNVIKQVDSLKDMHSLKDARFSLVEIIRVRHLTGSENNRVTIVFDGDENLNLFQKQNKTQFKIIFSKAESADESIKKIVQDASHPKQIVVVTDDKAIVFFVTSLGAKAMSVNEFLGEKQLDKKSLRKKIRRKTESQKIELTYQQQEAINQELRRLWK